MPKPEFIYISYVETKLPSISKGWPAIMSSLKSLLESGQALDVPLAALEIEGVE